MEGGRKPKMEMPVQDMIVKETPIGSERRAIKAVKRIVPPPARRAMRSGAKAARRAIAARTGMLPEFLIIGSQKCGTTSLYRYLTAHPDIRPATVREIGFFNTYEHYSKGLAWYRSHFPSILRKSFSKLILGRNLLTGEADTSYIVSPHALRRISRILPKAKLILILRNPVDRAYSHYQHSRRVGREWLSFEEALERETERVGNAWRRMLEDERYYSTDIEYYSYSRRGIYADQVAVLLSLFPTKQVLILQSEQFSADPPGTYRQVLEFLQVRSWELGDFERYNAGQYPSMNETTRRRLVDYFRPHNQRLHKYLGRTLTWDRWKEFLLAVTVANNPAEEPSTVALQGLDGTQIAEWNIQMAGAVLTVLSSLLVDVFLRLNFLLGLLAGALKG